MSFVSIFASSILLLNVLVATTPVQMKDWPCVLPYGQVSQRWLPPS